MKTIYLCAIFSLLFFTQAAKAQNIIECYGCDAISDYQSRARVALNATTDNPRESIREIYQVLNIETGTVYAFDAGRSYDYESRRVIYRIRPSQINYDLEYEAKDYIYHLNQMPRTVDTIDDVYDDVYDALRDPALEEKVSNYLFYTFQLDLFFARVGAYTMLPLSMLNKISGVNFVVSIQLSDGSTLLFKSSGISGPDDGYRIDWEFLSAKDSKNQDIPKDKSEVIGKIYSVEKGTAGFFISYIQALGVRYSSSIPSGSVTIIDCVGDSCEGDDSDGEKGED